MSDNFKHYSQYYDLLYQDKDYQAETKYIVELIEQYGPNSEHILELGSGTGIHAQLLAANGYQIFGIERSAEMVAIANQTPNKKVQFEVSDIVDFTLNQKFDVALSLFHVISYLTDNESLVKTFKNVHQHLNSEGLFIFDVWHSDAVHHQIPEKRTKTLQNDAVEITRKATPTIKSAINVVEVAYDISVRNKADNQTFNFKENHPMRHFCRPEIELLAIATGFDVIHSEEFLSKNEPSSATWGVCYIFKKHHK